MSGPDPSDRDSPTLSQPLDPLLAVSDVKVSDVKARVAEEIRLQRSERWTVLRRNPAFLVGALITAFWLICALFGSTLAPKDPAVLDPLNKLKGPSAAHWFGTDLLGRDVFSRVIVGARVILFIALGATILGTVLGTTMGLVAGYFKGIADDVLMRIADALTAMPVIVFAVLAVAALKRASNVAVLLVIGIVFTPIIARTVRATVLGEAELEYVAAARLRTEKTPHILFVELLPNVLPPVIVEFTVRLGYAIFAVATLSFLGVGVTPESPDWGTQVADHYGFVNGVNWTAAFFPAAAIATLAVGVNLLADGLLEAFER